MFDTQTDTPARQSLQVILQRATAPLLLFSAALCMMLLVSYMFLLPRFTQFSRSDGVAMSPRQLAAYEKSLAASITQREEERVRLVMPVNNETYTALKNQKHSTMSLVDLREQLLQAASRMGENEDVLGFDLLSIEGTLVTVKGDVRNVGTRSMTVLAAFSEEVAKLPFVTQLKRPAFTREGTPDTGFHSPFSLSFSLPQ